MTQKEYIQKYVKYGANDICGQDAYSVDYYAYDTKKKCHCIVTVSKVVTSWDIIVNY